MTQENAYAAPDAELITVEQSEESVQYYTVSTGKFLFLSILTINMYSLYWFYKNWQLQKLNANFDCLPVLRAIFAIFFTHSLFANINETAAIKNIEVKWDGFLLATLFVVLTIISGVMSNIEVAPENMATSASVDILITFLIIVPLYVVQKTVNQINGDPKGLTNNSFTWINWIFMILGVAFWGLYLIGSFGLLDNVS